MAKVLVQAFDRCRVMKRQAEECGDNSVRRDAWRVVLLHEEEAEKPAAMRWMITGGAFGLVGSYLTHFA